MSGKILVIDDDGVYRTHIADLLSDAGYDVETTQGTPEILDRIQETSNWKLAIIDPAIGRTDGYRLIEEIKRKAPSLDILVVSGLNKPEGIIKAFRCGGGDYVVKPFNPDELILSVSRLLGVKSLFHENRPFHEAIRLYDACRNLSACLDIDRLKGFVLEVGTGLMEASAGFAIIAEQPSSEAVVISSLGISHDTAEKWIKPLKKARLQTFAGVPKRLEELNIDNNVLESIREDEESLAGHHVLVLPLAFGENGWGAVVLAKKRSSGDFDTEKMTNARFLAKQALISFQNAINFETVNELNYIDDMTGLYNHRYLELTLEREIHKAKIEETGFAVLFADIDHFKKINDSHGHLIGRMVLVELGKVLKKSVREMDVVARYGGDEFVVVTRLCPQDSESVARRILEQLRDHVFLAREGKNIRLTASIGLANFPQDAKNTKALLDLADKAMYEGKKVGRDTVYSVSQLTNGQ